MTEPMQLVALDVLQQTRQQRDLNARTVRLEEFVYWLRLELSTTRLEKSAVEARMAELYRDLHEMHEISAKRKTFSGADGEIAELQTINQKYDRTIRTLNSQINLLRLSGEKVIHSLKDELRDLSNDKASSEMQLMNYISDLEREKTSLEKRVASLESSKNISPDAKIEELKADIMQLREEKASIVEERRKEKKEAAETIAALRKEKTSLAHQIEKMQGDLLVLRSSVDTVQSIDQMKEDRDESLEALEKVTTMWDKADEAIQNLDNLIDELKPGGSADQDRVLDTLESASLVHGEVKVALLLVELKLRNTLSCLKSDAAQLSVPKSDPVIKDQIKMALDEGLAAVKKLDDKLDQHIEKIEDRARAESTELSEKVQERLDELRELQGKQQELEKEVSKMSVEELGNMAREATSTNRTVELFVSGKILERLQSEVTQVVSRVHEKNEAIGHLEATIEEHKVREKSLVGELQKLMKDKTVRDRVIADGVLREDELMDEVIEEIIEDEFYDEEIVESTHAGGVTVVEEEEEVEEIVEHEEEIYEEEVVS